MNHFYNGPEDGDAPMPDRPVDEQTWSDFKRVEFWINVRFQVGRALILIAIVAIGAVILWGTDLLTKVGSVSALEFQILAAVFVVVVALVPVFLETDERKPEGEK